MHHDMMSQPDIFNELRQRGIAKLDVEFSGGNDEGGVDGLVAYDASGTEVPHSIEQVWMTREGMVGWGDDARPATQREKDMSRLFNSLAHPIYDTYYTFAGEFYVNGTLTWDVTNRKVSMSGEQSVETWDHFSYDL